ncbi:MAG: hypothetical protein HY811_11190 [Planctomycetes bacterium]|nr:hypothetical protein [Planctomycetota bacterium]
MTTETTSISTTNPIKTHILLLPYIWVLVSFLIFMFTYNPIQDFLYAFKIIIVFPLLILWLLISLVIFVVFVTSALRLWRYKTFLISLGYSVIYILLVVLLVIYGSWLTIKIRFEIKRTYYERIVFEIYSGQRNTAKNDRIIIDEGPPLRVAFHLQSGTLDHWCGIVYDPTGEIINTIKLKSIVPLFGAGIYRAEKLDDYWYIFWFT